MAKRSLFELENALEDALDDALLAEEEYAVVAAAHKYGRATDTALRDAAIDREIAYDTLAEVGEQLGGKLENYAKFIQNLTHDEKGLSQQIRAFTARRNAIGRTLDSLKANLLEHLDRNETPRVTVGNLTIAKQRSAPSVEISIPASELPAQFQRVTVEPRKNELRDAIVREGAEIEGVKVVQKMHIRVRPK